MPTLHWSLTSRLWKNLIVNLYGLQVITSWFGFCLEILPFQQLILISKRWNTKLHRTASWTRYEVSALFYLMKPPIRPRDFQNWQGIINSIFSDNFPRISLNFEWKQIMKLKYNARNFRTSLAEKVIRMWQRFKRFCFLRPTFFFNGLLEKKASKQTNKQKQEIPENTCSVKISTLRFLRSLTVCFLFFLVGGTCSEKNSWFPVC